MLHYCRQNAITKYPTTVLGRLDDQIENVGLVQCQILLDRDMGKTEV